MFVSRRTHNVSKSNKQSAADILPSLSPPPELEETFEDSGSVSLLDRPEEEQDEMKGVSVGLISPDRMKSTPSFDMAAVLAQQAAQVQVHHQQQHNSTNNTCNNASEDQHDDFFGQDLSPIRSMKSEEPPPFLSPTKTPPNSIRVAGSSPQEKSSGLRSELLKHLSGALEIEAVVTREEDEEDDQDEELLTSTKDLLYNKLSSGKNRPLNIVLGVAALLDFLSALSPIFLRRPDNKDTKDTSASQYLYSVLFSKIGEQIEERGPIRMALAFLGRHSDTIGIVFSLLWFLHSFGHAARVRNWVLRKRDRKKLLGDEQGSSNKSLDYKYSPLKRIDSQESSSSSSTSIIIDWVGGAWGVYLVMITWQLLLLPVGFYTTTYQVLTGDAVEGIHHVPKCIGDHCTMATVVTSKFQQSLLYVVCQQAAYYISHRIREEAKEELRHRFARLKRFLMRFAIRHPMQFKRRLKRALKWLRWIRYVIPLIGGLNKLKGNTEDLLKKYRQRQDTKVLQRFYNGICSRKRFRDLSPPEKESKAPVAIQTAWRARQKRKQMRALKLFQRDPEVFAAMKLQNHFRAWLSRSRARLKRKKVELALLQQMERRTLSGKSGPHLSALQRRRMYQLQDELKLAVKKRRQIKMLLRPNTRFAVTWKFLFVSCLLIEITQLAMQPKLKRFHEELALAERRKCDVKDMDWYTFMQAKLVPTPAPEWDECGKAMEAGIRPPWYCNRPFTDIHFVWIKSLEFAIAEALVFISVVMFLDVFISFFTGEIDGVDGQLVPKPFIKRWIVPGILIQFLMNPRMLEVSAAAKAFIRHMLTDVGPVTAWRWSAALFIPLFGYTSERFNRRLWRRIVREENARAV